MGPIGLNLAQDEFFCHFLEFGSLVFLELTYNDSLEQCQTSNRGKTHKKNNLGGPILGQKQARN